MNTKNARIYLTVLFALVLGIFVDYLFYGKEIGVSFFIFNLILIGFSLFLIKNFGQLKSLKKDQAIILSVIMLLSFFVFLRASFFLIFFNAIVAIYLIFLFFISLAGNSSKEFNLFRYLILPCSFVFGSFRRVSVFIADFFSLFNFKKRNSSEFLAVIRGIIISLPILAVFIGLFSSADIVFQKYLDGLWDIEFNQEIILRALIVILSFYFFLGFLDKIFIKKKTETKTVQLESKDQGLKLLGNTESLIILSSTIFLFFIFVVIQFSYLFGGKNYVWGAKEYITYSEYAKTGFGELTMVLVISFFLIWGINKFCKKERDSQKNVFKALSGILILEVFVIMTSAFSRISLYVDGYGFTFERLLVYIFLFWLFFAFIFLLYKIFSKKKVISLFNYLFWLSIIFLLGINILNPDEFIARKNIEKYLESKRELDVYYLTYLSADAIPEIVKIFNKNGIEEKIKEDLACELNYWPEHNYLLFYDQYEFYNERGDKDFLSKKLNIVLKNEKWQSFNFSKKRAIDILSDNLRVIEDYKAKSREREEREIKKEIRECEKECKKNFSANHKRMTKCKKECDWAYLEDF